MNKTITIYAFILGLLLVSQSCEKTSIEEYATAQGWVKQEVKPDDQTKPDNRPTSHGTVIETGVVDLGLSVNWAACNLSSSTENHFTEICTHVGEKYSWSAISISYPPESISGSAADNATVLLGYPWRTPTTKDIQELKDKCYITHSWHRGIGGLTITGPSGKTIFIPDEGNGNRAYYWTSSYNISSGCAIAFIPYNNYYNIYFDIRTDLGGSKYIRPVRDK